MTHRLPHAWRWIAAACAITMLFLAGVLGASAPTAEAAKAQRATATATASAKKAKSASKARTRKRSGRTRTLLVQKVRLRRTRAFAAGTRLARPSQLRATARVLPADLSWKAVSGATGYRITYSIEGFAGSAVRDVTGTSATIAQLPAGVPVSFRVAARTASATGPQSAAVTTSALAAETTVTPDPQPTPQPEPSTGLRIGLVTNPAITQAPTAVSALGARLVRVEFPIGAPITTLAPIIGAFADRGVQVLPLAGFHGTMPTTLEAQNLATWAAAFGPGGTFWATRGDGTLAVRHIEFGNETSYSYQYGDSWDSPSYTERARTYALRFRDAHVALAAVGGRVGLLAQGEDGGTGSANWVNGMFAAVPDLASRVAGWTIHPYGPNGAAKIDRMVNFTRAAGAPDTIPIHITEWGVATDDGRCLSDNYGWDRCMTYTGAANALRTTVADLRTRYGSRLASMLLYMSHDGNEPGLSTDRETYFGVMTLRGADKGAYTSEVRANLALYP